VIDPTTLLPAPPTLATARLRLRPIAAASDAAAMFAVFSDEEAMRYWSEPPHAAVAATQAMLEKCAASFAAGSGIEWAIVQGGSGHGDNGGGSGGGRERASGGGGRERAGDGDGGGGDVAVGKIGLWRWQRAHSRGEIGFILRRDLWRQGLASEALGAVVRFGFSRLELHSVEAQLDGANDGSARTLERAGFVREGRLRQSYFDGRSFRDTLIYGLLAAEWRARHPS
jgi:RimJ/RimL family protein N-acetyltransferase